MDGDWRLITNLSAPTGNQCHDALCSVSYAFFDQAITKTSVATTIEISGWECIAKESFK